MIRYDMWTKKTAPIENCFGSKFSIKRLWVFVSHALRRQRKAEFKAVRSRGIAAIAARADFWPSFVSLWPSFKLRNRSKMELSWKTAPWQVSFKVVPNVFMELQVIIKSYTSMSYYTSMYRKKTEADNGLVIFGSSTFKLWGVWSCVIYPFFEMSLPE